MDVAGFRERMTESLQSRRTQALDLIDRIPIAGRLLTEFVRIELIDRCMLIAAQGLLALVPMLVVIASFFPHIAGDAVHTFAAATGVGQSGNTMLQGEVSTDQVRAQTGVAGVLITIFSASSFSRAIQRMYEKVWEQHHIGGVVGYRRCLFWLIGWLVTLQLIGGLRAVFVAVDGLAAGTARLVLQMIALALVWWVTTWVLLFGRVAWRRIALGAVLTGVLGVVYTRGSTILMPPYVQANADQFGTLGIILAVSTWLIGYAGIMVGVSPRRTGRVRGPDSDQGGQLTGWIFWNRAWRGFDDDRRTSQKLDDQEHDRCHGQHDQRELPGRVVLHHVDQQREAEDGASDRAPVGVEEGAEPAGVEPGPLRASPDDPDGVPGAAADCHRRTSRPADPRDEGDREEEREHRAQVESDEVDEGVVDGAPPRRSGAGRWEWRRGRPSGTR